MVSRLPSDMYARQVLLSSSSSTSWFVRVRNLLLQYQLPHPLYLLHNPPTKEAFKKLVKAKVIDFWETKLRSATSLLSMPYFHPQYLSLKSPHKLWSTAGPKSYEVSKARIQPLFLSAQYPSAKFSRHWSQDNPLGICSFSVCKEKNVVESSEHILLSCPAYSTTRQNAISMCLRIRDQVSHLLVTNFLLCGPPKIMQFLLDCSVMPEVIYWAQHQGDYIYNDLFYLGRTWCYAIHRERMKRLCKWNFK